MTNTLRHWKVGAGTGVMPAPDVEARDRELADPSGLRCAGCHRSLYLAPGGLVLAGGELHNARECIEREARETGGE